SPQPPCPSAPPLLRPPAPLPLRPTAPRLLYFDLETQKSAEEVGGWENRHLMRLACAVVYDDLEKRFHIFLEEEIPRLVEILAGADLVVGFNLIRFDYGVLRGYTPFDFSQVRTFDILVDVRRRLGFRLSLDHLAGRTLNVRKTADGLQSLRWFKEGKLDKIIEYCRKDVEITRDLFLFGLKNHYLVFERREGGVVRLPVDWDLEILLSKI
ncbi:MAG: ribonuclease H-like domain-containing protein, partial [Nitrospinae bacterium]|nr:ribonuclease H-like domain-containing protein [Nitrospinota bacterium]